MRFPPLLFVACIAAFAQDGPAPFRAGNGVSAPRVVSKTDPEYSEEARLAKLSGTVAFTLVVGEDGTARDVRVVRPLGLGLDEKAIEAVRGWRFNPGMKDGMPVPVRASIEVNFRLLSQDWRLTHAAFDTPEGADRPVLIAAPYPSVSIPTGETGTVTISLDVTRDGTTENLRVDKSSDPSLESETLSTVRGWKFRPAVQDGNPVPVRCTLDFAIGN